MNIITTKNNSNETKYLYLNKFSKKNNKSEVFNKRHINNSYLQMDSKYFEKYKSSIYCQNIKNTPNNMSFGGIKVACTSSDFSSTNYDLKKLVFKFGELYLDCLDAISTKVKDYSNTSSISKQLKAIEQEYNLIDEKGTFDEKEDYIYKTLNMMSTISFDLLEAQESHYYAKYISEHCAKHYTDISTLSLDNVIKNKEKLEAIQSKEETTSKSFLMRDEFCFSKLADKYPILLSIHDNISKLFILNYIVKDKNILDINLNSANKEDGAIKKVNYSEIRKLLTIPILIFNDLVEQDREQVEKLYLDIAKFTRATIEFYIYELKTTYLHNLINQVKEHKSKQKNSFNKKLPQKKEYEEPALTDKEREELLQELLAEEDNAKVKPKSKVSKKKKSKKTAKKTSSSSVKKCTEEPTIKEKEIVKNKTTEKILTESEFCEDIVDNGEFVEVGFNLGSKISSLFLEHKIEIEYIKTEYEEAHEHYLASKDLTKFFFENVLSEETGLNENIKNIIKYNQSSENDRHFVGALLARLQKINPNITFLEAIEIFTNIVNNGIILHSNKGKNNAKLELYSSQYKLIIPFEVNSEKKCIHFKTLLDYNLEKDQKTRRVHNPAGDKLAYSTLLNMHSYYTEHPENVYKLTDVTFDDLEELYTRNYVI